MTLTATPVTIDLTEMEFDLPCEAAHHTGPEVAEWMIFFYDPMPCGCTVVHQAWCTPCLNKGRIGFVCHHFCGTHGMPWKTVVEHVETISHPNVG